MKRGIVYLCRSVTRLVVINLLTIAFTLLGAVVLGLFPALAAAHAASAEPLETPIPRLARRQFATWKREFVRVNAAALPLLAPVAVAAVLLRGAEGAFLRAPLFAVALAGLGGALAAAALAGLNAGTARALWLDLGRVWLARPWAPLSLVVIWGGAAALPLVHPLLGLYLTASLAALAGNRILDGAATVTDLPVGQGA